MAGKGENTMANEKLVYETYGDFSAEHPEYAEKWREFTEPVILAEDDGIYGFLFGYLLI
jgi:hypothetical protein